MHMIERLHSIGLFLAALCMLALAAMAAGCSSDRPEWRTVTLMDDCLPVRARDEKTGATIRLFPLEGDQIQVRLAPEPSPSPVPSRGVILSRVGR